jgi:hypothetical protein
VGGKAARVSPPDLTKWVTPNDSVLMLYEAHWTPTTDAPREYLVPSGLAVIGTVLGTRAYLPFGGDRIMPNLWQIILGPSSTYRKSTTVKQARRTLTRLSEGQPHALLFPDEFSKEALVAHLAESPQGLLTYSEFSGALAGFSRDYMSGTKELLADLYDSPPKYERLVGKTHITATNVCLSILAASQTDWLLEKLKESDVRGGFMARFTYWPAFTKRRFLAIPPEPDAKIGRELVKRLNALRQLEGPLVLPSSVQDRYTAWLRQHEQDLDALPRAGQLGPFWSRLGMTTLKLALILHVSTAGTLRMDDAALDSAIGLAEFLKRALAHLFEEEIAFTADMRNRQKVLQAIRRHPGIAFRDLSRSCSLLKRSLDAVLETVLAEGLVEVREKRYWPVSVSASVSEDATDTKRPMIARVK